MKFKKYLNESNIKDFLIPLRKLTFDKAKKTLKNGFNDMLKIIEKNGLDKDFLKIINKHLKLKITSIKSLKKLHENTLNEDIKHFWKVFKMEGWPAISVFPALSLWFEFDKLFDGISITELNWQKISAYGILWLILVMGKHITGWAKWRKKNPDEFEKEGKPGILRKGKNK